MKTAKIATLAATAFLSFALVACGGGAVSSSVSSSASSAGSSASAESSSSETANSATSSSIDPANANTYTNDAFGIRYNLPDGWKFTDAATLARTNSVIKSAASSSAIDMVATNADSTTSVILAIINPSDETAGKSAEDFLKAQTDQMVENLDGNYAYTSNEAEVTFNGMDRKLPAMVTNITSEGNTMVICQAVAEKDGHFLNFLSVGTSEDEVLNAFKAFKSAME